MLVYRIQKRKYSDPLSLIGASRAPGRWHEKTVPLLYTACNPSLAVSEVEVHLQQSVLLFDWLLWELDVDDHVILEYSDYQPLPENWMAFPHTPASRIYGSNWVIGHHSVGLQVPSAIIAIDYNVLLNIHHPDAANTIEVNGYQEYVFDQRKW